MVSQHKLEKIGLNIVLFTCLGVSVRLVFGDRISVIGTSFSRGCFLVLVSQC